MRLLFTRLAKRRVHENDATDQRGYSPKRDQQAKRFSRLQKSENQPGFWLTTDYAARLPYNPLPGHVIRHPAA